MQEKIITLNSETELKSFLVGQLQEQKCALESNLADFCEELQKKKTEITRLSEKVQLLKNSELYASQTIDTLKVEKEFLEAENEKNKQKASAF